MSEDQFRGGCDGMPLQLTGAWTGYNTGATMQVGLWIANDGDHILWARRAAMEGPVSLRQALTGLMRGLYRDAKHQGLAEEMLSLPASVWVAVLRSDGGPASIDWAQICFDLVYAEPDEQDMAREEWGVEDDTAWELAVRRREILAAEIAMTGVEQ